MSHRLAARYLAVKHAMTQRLAHAGRRDAGMETIEIALWAAAVVVVAGLIIAAVTAFVTRKIGILNGG